MLQVTANIDGMMCGMCEAHVKDAVRKVFPDAKKINASAAGGRLEFQIDQNLPVQMIKHDLKAALDSIGYKLTDISSDNVSEEEKGGLLGRFRHRK